MVDREPDGPPSGSRAFAPTPRLLAPPGMYISLARKYRPKTFAAVAVQSHVSNTLKGAIARGRVAHGYLLCGPRGVGKTTLARVLAMALNCERRDSGLGTRDSGTASGEGAQSPSAVPSPESRVPSPDSGEPCGECASCRRIWSGSASLDVVEIDAASNRGVDDARELRERAMYAPSSEGHYKVYIVGEAHMLTREAWNALLKILEEPPPRVVFVFATTEPQKIAQAAAPVLSRLQRFDFRRIGPADIRDRLMTVLAAEHVEAEPDAVALIARAADGSMRDALSLADQALSVGAGALTAERVRDALGLVPDDEYLTILDLVAEGRAGDIFPAIARLVDAGVDLGGFLSGLTDTLRALLALTLGAPMPDLSERMRDALAVRTDRLAAGDLLRMLHIITELEPHCRRSGQQQLLLESLHVRFALMDRTVSLEDVLRGMGGEGSPGIGRRTASTGHRGAEEPRSTSRAPSAERSRSAPPEPPHRQTDDAPPTAQSAHPKAHSSQLTAQDPAPTTQNAAPPLDLNALVERWGEIVAQVRADGRALLAAALDQTM